MKKSIEAIWKEGFLHEKSLVAPQINDLYNQKSKHLVDQMIRRFRVNLRIIVITAIIFPIIYSFLGFIWQGVVASILLLLTAWYTKRQMQGLKALDQGVTSLDYLKSFDRWLKDALSKSAKIARFSYPLYLLIALSTIWSAWNKQESQILKIQQTFPDVLFINNVPVVILLIVGVTILLMVYFSAKIYQWEVRLLYGRVFDKLEETIAEMENLKQGF